MDSKKISDKDYHLLVKYLTLNKNGLEFLIDIVRTIGDIREDIGLLTGNNLDSIGNEYNDLSADEYLNTLIIDRNKSVINTQSNNEIMNIKINLNTLSLIILERNQNQTEVKLNEYRKEKIILSEYSKMDVEYRKSLPDWHKVLDDYTLVKELKDIKELESLYKKQKDILFLLKIFSLPKTFFNPDDIILMFNRLNDFDSAREQLFVNNYDMYFQDELKEIQNIRNQSKTLRINMTNKFRDDVKNL